MTSGPDLGRRGEPSPLTAAALAGVLIEAITGAAGDEDGRWSAIIGPVHQLPVFGDNPTNWAVIPGGTRRERNVISEAAEAVRGTYPYVND